jgi:MYXO-CTERM domain-containing protein
MVISQIYPGGGNSGAVLTYDYVELFNRGTAAVAMTGWSLQYAPASSTSWQVHALPTTTVQPGGYFLVQLATQNPAVGSPLPVAADSTGSVNLAVSAGKVALLNTVTACADPCEPTAAVVDLVGYGTTASEYEGARAPAPSGNNSALLRKSGGCVETNNNSSDFALGTWVNSSSLALHNSSSTPAPCAASDAGVDAGLPDAAKDAAKPDAPASDAPTPVPGAVVISQIYGAGGNSGAKYTHDYVELFNRSASTVSIGGWSIQYGSSAGAFSEKADLPAATIDPGQYYLIQLASGATGVTLPTPDLVTSGGAAFNMSASAGKVALVANATLLPCGTAANRCASSAIIDLVGYGGASDYEGAAAPAPAQPTQAMFRRNGGCVDTADNSADIETATASARNSAAPVHGCATNPDGGSGDGPFDAALPDAAPPPPAGAVVISQVYGAGGNGGAKYTHDYVELFNRSTASVAIGGWSVQYGTSANALSQKADIPPGAAIGPGRHYLVQLAGGSAGVGLPAPDLATSGSAAYNMSASAGKVALVAGTQLLPCGTASNRCASPYVMDLVGYGGAADFEGAPTPAPSTATQAKLRKNAGCVDSGDNASDFETATANPRNSAAAAYSCAPKDGGLPDQPKPPDAGPAKDAALPVAGAVVVSQIYGAGGNVGAKYTHDYVELFNRTSAAVPIGGWSIQYGTAANDFSQKTDIPAGTVIDPGGYFLIQLAGGTVGASLPTPDLVASGSGTYNVSATSGKVALVANATLLACGTAANRCSSAAIMDLVGYGAASDYEGAATTAPGLATQAKLRRNGGCVDTADNSADIETATASARNSAAPAKDCTVKLDAGPPEAAVPDTPKPPDGPKADASKLDAAPDKAALVDKQLDKASLQPDKAVDAAPVPSRVVVVSQLYASGGNSGASFTNDFVELFNRGTQAISIGGWSIQYGSAAGDFTQKLELPTGATLPPGGYYLVQLAGGGNGSALPTPDHAASGTGAINLGSSGGKVALVGNGLQLSCGSATNRCSSTKLEDMVGYGGASDYEAAPAAAPGSAAAALHRKLGGCLDTDNNASDFLSANATPRNGASPKQVCGSAPDLGPKADLPRTDLPGPGDLGAREPRADATAPASDGRRDAAPRPQSKEGCACRVSEAPASGTTGWLLLGALVVGRLLRRRQRACTAGGGRR